MKTTSRGLATGLTLALAGFGLVAPMAPAFAAPPPPTATFTSYGNPILSDGTYYSADAAPMVHDDTLYVYTGHDIAGAQSGGFNMRDYGVFATEELNPAGEATTWDHYRANLEPGDVFEWATGLNAFAGHVAEGPDGNFYWYAPVETVSTAYANRMAIGVAVSDSPVGPWTDAIGEPLIDWGDVFGSSSSGQEVIDPHLFRDDDGKVYLYWGSWYIARMVELEPDMITRVDPSTAGIHQWTQAQGLPSFFEAPWVFKRSGTYYMVYDWKNGGSDCTPSNYQGCIGYSTAPSPTGPWTFRGLILGGTSATTVHPSVIEFGDSWYITYHTKDAANGGHFRRSVAIDEIAWDDTQTPPRLLPVTPTLDPAVDPKLASSENVARGATPSASYTETPPMDVRALNNGRVTTALLPPDQWGNYRAARNVQTDWTQYDWAEPVLIDGAGIQFGQDSNWIRPPASWKLQYRDSGGGWVDVPNPSGYPTTVNTWLTLTFDPIVTTGLRATYNGLPNAAQFHSVAVSEWEVYSVQADTLGSATVATLVGEAPALPATVQGEFPGGHTLDVPVTWKPVAAADYQVAGTFTVEGRALGQAGDLVTAEVTVVSDAPRTNHAGDATLTASYTAGWNNLAAVNDGERPSLATPPGNAQFWGTWSGTRPESQWLQYTWAEPVDVAYVEVGFAADGGPGRGTGIEVPESWSLEYWDGEDWAPVTGVTPAYPVEQGSYVGVAFDAISTTQLRLTANALLGWLEGAGNDPGQYAGVGVSEWEAWNQAPDVTAPVVTVTPQGTPGLAGWFVSPVNVRIEAADDSLARVTIETSADDGETWDAVEDVREHTIVLSTGEHELLVRATDPAGNTSAVQSVAVKVDFTPPSASAVDDYDARTVTVSASDAGSGLASVEVNVDAAGWTAYTEVLELSDAKHVVQYRATDNAGNSSSLGTATLQPKLSGVVGNIAPFASVEATFTAGWNSLAAVNDGVRAALTGGAQTNFWGTWSGTRPATQSLTYTWPVPVTVGSSTIGFWNDGGPGRGDGVETPTGWSLEYWDAGSEGWVPVEVSAAGYPVSATAYTTAEFTPVTTTRLRVTIQARQGTSVATYAAMAVPEWEVDAVAVDVEQPEAHLVVLGTAGLGGWYTSASTQVRVDAAAQAGDVTISTSLNEGDWVEVAGRVATVTLPGDGTHTVRARVTDSAEQVSEIASITVKVDATAPVATAVVDPEARSVTVTATDAVSGSPTLEYRIDDAASWTAYTAPVVVGDARTEVHYRVTDAAGNVTTGTAVVLAADGGPALEGNIGPLAEVEASYTAGWNNLDAVNDGEKPALTGSPENSTFWGTWSGDRPASQWLSYTWDSAVSVDSVTIGFAYDGGPGRGTGIELPESWHLEYWDGAAWLPMTGVQPSYPVSGSEYVSVKFDAVETTAVRAVLDAQLGWLEGGINAPGEYAGVGVTELEVFTEGTGPDVGDLEAPALTVTLDPASPDGGAGWYTSDVTVTAVATDETDPAPVVERFVEGAWTAVTEPISVGEGVTALRLRAVDETGNASAEWTGTLRVDRTAPVSQAVLDGRTVTLKAADSGSGVDRVEYSVAGATGPFVAYAGPVTVAGSGAASVHYRAVDRAGHVEQVGSVRVPAAAEGLVTTSLLAHVDKSKVAFGSAVGMQIRLTAVGGATVGRTTVALTDNGKLLRNVTLVDGRATVALSRKLAVGTHRFEVAYAGSATFASARAGAQLKVTKATSTTKVTVKPAKIKVTSTKRVTVKATVRASGLVPQGRVQITVTQLKGKKVVYSKQVKLSKKGVATAKLPRLKTTGKYRVKVSYLGSGTIAKSKAKSTTIRVVKR